MGGYVNARGAIVYRSCRPSMVDIPWKIYFESTRGLMLTSVESFIQKVRFNAQAGGPGVRKL